MTSNGKSLELFFIDGRPDGMLTAGVLRTGKLVHVGDHTRFQKDCSFSSPSAAAAILKGRAANGRTSWGHSVSGKTFADWEAAQIDALAQEGELS
ncbi:DUF4357 domain-containing protein [Ascidiaceihabitans sp.]|uniref:DUF4357 domain-containing protein n=1 Tax=Ascidiaceihabitans sp. TaxID=1872644 RepID=UPI003297DF6C